MNNKAKERNRNSEITCDVISDLQLDRAIIDFHLGDPHGITDALYEIFANLSLLMRKYGLYLIMFNAKRSVLIQEKNPSNCNLYMRKLLIIQLEF